jgi:tetratricopeptide (TPR) repeat protein
VCYVSLSQSLTLKSFAQVALVLGLVLPFSWCIAVWKLRAMTTNASASTRRDLSTRTKRGKLQTAQAQGAGSNEKAACLALTIGRLYEDMGSAQNSIKIFDEALALWRFDPNRGDSLLEKESSSNQAQNEPQKSISKLIGGFTEVEINSFTANDLEFILQLTIAKAKFLAIHKSYDVKCQKVTAQTWVDALDIYEHSPEALDIRDKSIIFPIFSGLFVFLKSGVINDDKHTFEQDIVEKLVSETRSFGDPVHYCRALAMKAAFLAKFAQYEESLDLFSEMRDLYVAEEHSAAVTAVYGSDRCAQAFSQSALWQMALGNEKEALSMCEYVINRLMPKMDLQNVFNSTVILLPVIRVLKFRGQTERMKHVFQQYIMHPYLTHIGEDGATIFKSVYKPLSILLDVETSIATIHEERRISSSLSRETLLEHARWVVGEENGLFFPEMVENALIELGYNPYSIVCELCLLLGKLLRDESAFCRKLVSKGLKLAQRTSMKMLDGEGCEAEFPIPFEVHFPIADELDDFSDLLQNEKKRRRSTLSKASSTDTMQSSICELPLGDLAVSGEQDKISLKPTTLDNLRGSAPSRRITWKLPKLQRRRSLQEVLPYY